MKTTLHKSNTRGNADHGWLKSHHTFSFANYYNPERMSFGALRVLNDDQVAASQGFGTHPHDNMEIVTVVLEGALKHKDTMGNEYVIKAGEVQIMSAGTGVAHSEYNNSNKEEVSLLQIWVVPEKNGIQPQYAQKDFSKLREKNKLQTLVSPNEIGGSLLIHQKAYFSILEIENGNTDQYKVNSHDNGVYVFIIEGDVEAADQRLNTRDGLGIEETDQFDLKAHKDSKILFIEVPV